MRAIRDRRANLNRALEGPCRPMFIPSSHRFLAEQTAEAGEAGAGQQQQPAEIAPEVQSLIARAVADATQGLKANNAALLAEKKAAQDRLKAFGDADPETINTILKRFTDGEEAALIKAGKIDEVLAQRTERMKSSYDKELKSRDERIAQIAAKAERLAAGKVSGALTQAASKTGALAEAMEDIVLRGQRQGWTIDEDGEVVAVQNGEVVLGKDGRTPLTPLEWAQSLRESAPHLWPRAQGSGATGSATGGTPNKKFSQMTEAERTQLYRDNPARFHQLKEQG